MLREALDAPTARLLGPSVTKDLTHVATHELGATLRRHLDSDDRVQDQP
jgi:hypothetical protein